MEYYKKIFGDVNFNSLRGAKFKTKLGTLATLTKLIYNGFTHNLGSEDGAVIIMNNYTLWRFVAPVGRWSPAGVAGRTLNDALYIVSTDCSNVPVSAWNDFCGFLSDPTIEMNVNQILHGGTSSIKVAYKNTDLPLIEVLPDFPAYARWVREHTGDAGELPLSQFTNGDNIILPIDLYTGTPVSFTLKTPSSEPSYAQDMPVLKSDIYTAAWTKTSITQNTLSRPIFMCATPTGVYVYSFETVGAIPQGWSVYAGGSYVPYDMEANPVVIPYSEGMEWTYLAKAFTDIQWLHRVEQTYRVKSDIDLSKFAGSNFSAEGNGIYMPFEVMYSEDETSSALVIFCGSGTDYDIYVYSEDTVEEDGVTVRQGWNLLVEDDSEAGFHYESCDMEANPLILSVADGQFSTTSMELCNEIVELDEEKPVVKEELSGTITFVFTF